MTPEHKKAEPKMDPNALYREEVFTDHQTGTIRRISPVKADGSPDAVRKTVYIGEAQLLTSAGALPLSFEIEAQSLGDAAQKYGEGVKKAYEAALEEFQELRRRASSGSSTARPSLPAGISMSMVSPSATSAMGPPAAASGET